jgi:hypothetical protein
MLSTLVPLVLLVPVTAVVDTAAATTETGLSIVGKPRLGIYYDDIGKHRGDVVRHRGQLTDAAGDPVAGASIYLERKLSTDSDWVRFDLGPRGTTNADGVYTYLTEIDGNAKYRTVYEGDADHAPVTSEVRSLKAMRDFNAALVEKPEKAVLKGRINPDWDNKPVAWEKRTCKTCSWKVVDTEKSGDHGAWSFDAGYPPVGKKWYFRAVVTETSDFVESHSAKLITTTTTTPARTAAARR